MMTVRSNYKFLQVIFAIIVPLCLPLWIIYLFILDFRMTKMQEKSTPALITNLVQEAVEVSILEGKINKNLLDDKLNKLASLFNINYVAIYDNNNIIFQTDIAYKKSHLTNLKESFIIQNGVLVISKQTFIKKLNRAGEKQTILVEYNIQEYSQKLKHNIKLIFITTIFSLAIIAICAISMKIFNKNKALLMKIKQYKKISVQAEELSLTAAGLAHETKNPLGVIRGLAQQIYLEKSTSIFAKKRAEMVMEEADITVSRLGEFINYAKLKTPEFAVLSAMKYITKTTSLVIDDFNSLGINLILDIDDIQILADSEVLSQIILNLLLNALNASEKGDTVTLKLKDNWNGKGTMTIADTGKGIKVENLDKIFKPYYTETENGHGIGLAIVKRMVEKSNWEISVSSEYKKGTIFTITNIELSKS